MSQDKHVCQVDASAIDVTDTTLSLMIYNNDGESYSHAFTVDKAGPISIFIYTYEDSYINAVYYSNLDWAGVGTSERWSLFDLPLLPNDHLAGGTTPHFSYTFETYIKGPINGTVNFFIEYDNGLKIMIEEVIQPFLYNGES